MSPMQSPSAMPTTPPLIPGLTQFGGGDPSQDAQGMQGMAPPTSDTASEAIPQLVAAITSVLQQAADLGPDVFDAVSNMGMAYIKQLKKKVGLDDMSQQMQGQGGMPPAPQGGMPPASPSPSPGQPGEDPRAAFLSQLMSGGQF